MNYFIFPNSEIQYVLVEKSHVLLIDQIRDMSQKLVTV